MIDRYKGAELLTALWRLGGEPQGLPTSHGILDQALFDLRDVLPEPLNGLTFSQTGVGLRCFELPGILLAAQETMLTSEPNPTYLATNVTLKEDAARQIVVDAAVSTRDARALGGRLREAVQGVRDRLGAVAEPVAA